MTRIACFSGCTALEKIVLPDAVTRIALYAFRDCTSLKEINIPEKVQFIDKEAFYGCTALTDIYIQSGIEVDISAFENCPKLTVHYIYS